MEDITMSKIFLYIMLAVATIVMASCASDLENAIAPTDKSCIQLVVGEFPTFGDTDTRAIGTPDRGKTSWAEGDELLLEMTSKTLGTKYAAFTYNGSSWELTSGELSYKEDEVPTFPHVYYAPNYKWEAGKLVLKEGKVAGTDEYIDGEACIAPNGEAITANFAHATRTHSRLRIATMPNVEISVETKGFTPANGAEAVDHTYSLTTDSKGNAYLYGTFANNSSVTVKYNDVALADYTFTEATSNGKSYVLDATVISETTSEAVKSAVAAKLASGKTKIQVLLPSDADEQMFNAVSEALDIDVLYGSIDLVVMGAEKIPEYAFYGRSQLGSVILPDVKVINVLAFGLCYGLKTVEAPRLNILYDGAFESCDQLAKLVFGPIGYADDSVFGIFGFMLNTDLVLSDKQKVMEETTSRIYEATDESLSETLGSGNKFLGYRFKSITFENKVE